MTPDVIYLDLDGVLVDILTAMVTVCGRQELLVDWPQNYNVHEVLGIEAQQLWARIDSRGSRFWAELEPYPWARELYAMLAAVAPTIICTSPTSSVASHAGKIVWLQRFFGPAFRDYMYVPAKHKLRLATPRALLVDDADANVEAFRAAGGRAILVPQPYNKLRAFRSDPMRHVRAAFQELIDSP